MNVGGSVQFWGRFTATANVGYKSGYLSGDSPNNTVDVHAYWRVDARLSCQIKAVTLFVAGQNLTRPDHVESSDGIAVPRLYQAGATVRLGGGK